MLSEKGVDEGVRHAPQESGRHLYALVLRVLVEILLLVSIFRGVVSRVRQVDDLGVRQSMHQSRVLERGGQRAGADDSRRRESRVEEELERRLPHPLRRS